MRKLVTLNRASDLAFSEKSPRGRFFDVNRKIFRRKIFPKNFALAKFFHLFAPQAQKANLVRLCLQSLTPIDFAPFRREIPQIRPVGRIWALVTPQGVTSFAVFSAEKTAKNFSRFREKFSIKNFSSEKFFKILKNFSKKNFLF